MIRNLFISSNIKKITNDTYKLNAENNNLKKTDYLVEEYEQNKELKFEKKYGHKYNPDEVITDKIIDIYTTEDNFESIGDFAIFDNHREADYTLYAVTEKDKFPLIGMTFSYDKRYLDNLSFHILPDYSYNLSNQQLEHILHLIEDKIFINEKLNPNATARNIDQFKADITMIELLGNYLDNYEKSDIIEKWLNKIKNSLRNYFLDPSLEKITVSLLINEDNSDEDRFLPMSPLTCYIISDKVAITNEIKEKWEDAKKNLLYDKYMHPKYK